MITADTSDCACDLLSATLRSTHPLDCACDLLASTLPRYRPVRLLGCGCEGTVWLAIDLTSGREVAAKLHRTRISFEQESCALAASDSIHVARLFEARYPWVIREAFPETAERAAHVESVEHVLCAAEHLERRGHVLSDAQLQNFGMAGGRLAVFDGFAARTGGNLTSGKLVSNISGLLLQMLGWSPPREVVDAMMQQMIGRSPQRELAEMMPTLLRSRMPMACRFRLRELERLAPSIAARLDSGANPP